MSQELAAAIERFHTGISSVPGMLEPGAARITGQLMGYQKESGIRGDFCEIGVFKGRYFLTVATHLRPRERALAVDIFDDQSQSRDTQGYTELGVPLENVRTDFENNIGRLMPAGVVVDIIARPSTELSPNDLGGNFRFFSIDGGHSHDVVLNDLRLADATITADGIVAVDDLFNAQWPGVISAFFEYLPNADIAPFALIPNKLLCCRPAMVDRYRAALREIATESIWRRDVDLARHEIDLFKN